MKLDDKICKVIFRFLKHYSEILGNRCCNDLERTEYQFLTNLFSDKELIELEKEFQKLNGTPDDFDPNHLTLLMYNWAFPSFLCEKLKEAK